MNQRTEYFSKIHKQQEALRQQFPSGDCLVISVNPGNNGACEVPLPLAAKLLVEGTHILASPDQCNAYRAAQEMARTQSPLIGTLDNARAQFAALMAAKDGRK
jgi:hypothetical protein